MVIDSRYFCGYIRMGFVTLMCKFQSEFCPIKVSYETHFEDLLVKIREKWSQLAFGNLSLAYSIAEFENCVLRNQKELSSMLELLSFLSLKIVKVEVTSLQSVYSLGNVSQPLLQLVPVASDTSCVLSMEEDGEISQGAHVVDRVLLSAHWSSLITEVGQKFWGGAVEFRDSLKKYAAECHFEYKLKRNTNKCITSICNVKSDKVCIWTLTATVQLSSGAFILRKFVNEHDCNVGVLTKDKGMLLSSKVVAGLIVDEVKNKPSWGPPDVVEHMRDKYGYVLKYRRAWKALQTANSRIFGNAAQSYHDLRWYLAATLHQNPGSHIELEVDSATQQFQRLFVSFAACIHGFAYVRPMLFVDGTHITGFYKGTLLCATGKNGNQGLYPLAFAIVDAENNENWLWFMEQLHHVVGNSRRLTFISDRNKGVLKAVPSVFPNSDHYFCIYHLKENLKKRFSASTIPAFKRNRLVELFHNCAYASTEARFATNMSILQKEGGHSITKFLKDLPVKNWVKAYSSGCRYGEMSLSAAESFNSWILDCRNRPIMLLVDGIRIGLMKWYSDRKTESEKWKTLLCKSVVEKIQTNVEKCRTWRLQRSSAYVFEVGSEPTHHVDVSRLFCSCGRWQLDGFPCHHALWCFKRADDLDIVNYVDKYFFTASYRNSYEGIIYPIPTALKEQFDIPGVPSILPPNCKKPSGRPNKKRYKSNVEAEDTRKLICGRCGIRGNHNKKTCTGPISVAK